MGKYYPRRVIHMKLILDNEQWELENNRSSIQVILEVVSNEIEKDNVVFSHLIVDGSEIYESHETYLETQIGNISSIQIITRSHNEMISETMQSIHDYLNGAVPALQDLIKNSFDTFSDETWHGINQLAEGMQWILRFAAFTQNSNKKPKYWDHIEKSVVACETSFKQLMEGVEMQDTVLILDILLYEVVPAYEKLNNNLGESLQSGEFMKDAH